MLAHLRTSAGLGGRSKISGHVPKIKKPQRAKGGKRKKQMKGRTIVAEEFDRMLANTAKVVGELVAPSIRYYLRGLWLSGLRLAESLALRWDEDGGLSIDLSGKYPMLRIRAESQKSNEDEKLPISPEFAEFLLTTPEAERIGYVFNVRQRQQRKERASEDWVSRMVSKIGETAMVKVHTSATGRVKFASCHDLRRSFGTRWSKKVMPATLQRLMHRADISTTMAFYVDRQADDVAAELWATVSNGQAGQAFGKEISEEAFHQGVSVEVANCENHRKN